MVHRATRESPKGLLRKIESRILGLAVSILAVYRLSVILPRQQVFENLEEDFSNACFCHAHLELEN